MTLTRHENGAGATPTYGRRRQRGGGGAQLYLIGLQAYLTRRLQSVLNAAARLIFNLRRSGHVSDAPHQPSLAAFF